jgi:protein-disulfide isomerase
MTSPDPAPGLAVPIGDGDHVIGPADAPLSLVVYGDYECPETRWLLPVVASVRERLDPQVRYAYRHFPLRAIHPHAQLAAEAAEAAAATGMFWAMHDLLFANQRALTEPDLVRYAQELGFDPSRFGHELMSHRYAPRVDVDVASGLASGVEATPAIFVDGVRYGGTLEQAVLVEALLTSGGLA